MPDLLAISDLHLGHPENRAFLDAVRPRTDADWLIVAGDVADRFERIVGSLAALKQRFATVIWVPGNHDLWTLPEDRANGCGEIRYLRLVAELRRVGVLTPEDPFPTWGALVIAPLFVLYDYSFRPPAAADKQQALAIAEAAGVVCADEYLLSAQPYDSREAWAAARLLYSRTRLDALEPATPTVLINHWPLVRHVTEVLRHPEFALWCGTEQTADWAQRYRARAVVYGHLHIPRTVTLHGVAHHEVSLGYPREWDRPGAVPRAPVTVLSSEDSP